jgi:phospholipid/cholesterol/gamma-HCH transport system substrate-binding protein
MTRRLLHGLLAALTLVGGLGACSNDAVVVRTTFADSGDLQPRGAVQMADVRIGSITRIRLTKDFRSEVTMRLSPSAKVPKDSEPLLRTTSLLGERFVELRPRAADPAAGPYLADGDDLGSGQEAPELEFIAQEAVTVLGGVISTDVATIVQTGAEGFGGRGAELRTLVTDLATISRTLAARTTDIGRIIDGLDKATQTLAAGRGELSTLLDNLTTTTKVLADNRQKAVDALVALTRVSQTGDDLVRRYRADLDRQLRQVDVVLGEVAGSQVEVGRMLDFLDIFITGLPKTIPRDFTQVYEWVVPSAFDCRSPGNVVGPCPASKRPTP